MAAGVLHEKEVREQVHFYRIPIAADNNPQSQVAIIEVQAASPTKAEISTEEVQILMRMDGLKHIQAYYQQDIYKIIVMDTHNRIVILATHPDAKLTEQAEQLLGELRCLIKVDASEADVTIGIGQLYSGWGVSVSLTVKHVVLWITRRL